MDIKPVDYIRLILLTMTLQAPREAKVEFRRKLPNEKAFGRVKKFQKRQSSSAKPVKTSKK